VIGHGLPADNYQKSIEFWKAAGGKSAPIVPMAGELGSVTAPELKAHAAAAAAAGIRALHFYCHETTVKSAVWQAISSFH
jgi:hypothetical protein